MTGAEHYREAERMAGHCAIQVADAGADGEYAEVGDITRAYIALAQVHATLAVAAALADPYGAEHAWAQVIR